MTWRILPMGEAALLAEYAPADLAANRRAQALAAAIDARQLAGVDPAVPAISSVLVPFDPLHITFDALASIVADLIDHVVPLPDVPARVIELPVRYGGAHGPDLLDVARALDLTPPKVIALHSAPIYRVLLIGFAPGFAYLGPLPERLHLPRRATPRTHVPAGSVAIAAEYSGIYPARLPGGWHLIGQTDAALFDPLADPPVLLQPGDGVRFVPLRDGTIT